MGDDSGRYFGNVYAICVLCKGDLNYE